MATHTDAGAAVDTAIASLREALMDDAVVHKFGRGVVVFSVAGVDFTLDTKAAPPTVARGRGGGTPDVTLTFDHAEDFVAVSLGKLSPTQAFGRGKLKLKGAMGLAMKLSGVMDAARRHAHGEPAGAAGGVAGSGAVAPARGARAPEPLAAATPALKSDAAFRDIAGALERDGEALAARARGVYRFIVTHAGAAEGSGWLLDLSAGRGSVARVAGGSGAPAPTPAPDVTLTLSDDDMAAMAAGALSAQQVRAAVTAVAACCTPNRACALRRTTGLRRRARLAAIATGGCAHPPPALPTPPPRRRPFCAAASRFAGRCRSR